MFNNKPIILLVSLLFAVLFSAFVSAAVNLESPAAGAWTSTTNDSLAFIFNVSAADFATGDILCNLTLSGSVVATNLSVKNETSTALYSGAAFALGANVWSVNCSNTTTVGNSAAQTFYFDNVPPSATITIANHTWYNTATPQVSFTLVDLLDNPIDFRYFIDGASDGSGVSANNTNNLTATLSAQTNGTHTVIVQATDEAGNKANSSSYTIYVDTAAPVVTLVSPADNFNTSSIPATLQFNVSDNLGSPYNCSLYINNTYNQSTWAANATTASFTFGAASGMYAWKVNCSDNATNYGASTARTLGLDDQVPIVNSVTVTEPDDFVSGVSPNNNITLSVNASDVGTGVKYVTANLTNLTGSGFIGGNYQNMTYSSGLWSLVVTLADTTSFDFATSNITVVAYDHLSQASTNPAWDAVLLYNMTTMRPSPDGCSIMASGSTDFSTETDWNRVNVTLLVDRNFSTSCMPGIPAFAADNTFHRVAKFNFTNMNLTTQAAFMQLGQFMGSIDIQITPDGTFGNSRIYLNSSAVGSFNRSVVLTFYGLPFDSLPAIIGDAGTANNGTSITYAPYTTAQGVFGNLTFTVSGFSGYNVSDTANPLITVNAPTPNTTTVQGPTPLINITINGTGTQVSNLTVLVDGTTTYYMSQMTCYNATGSEVLNCYFSPTLGDATHSLVINTWDYGLGTAPGNTNQTVWIFTSDSAAPSVTNNQSNVTGIVNSNTVILLNVTVTDSTNVSSVKANGVNMGNHTATGYNLTTTPAALGCTASGTCTVTFNATDFWGNSNTSVVTSFVVDVGPPSVSGTSVTNATNVSSSVAVNIQATVSDPANVASVRANGQTMYLLSGTAASGVWYANLTAGSLSCASNAVCTITINASDTLGNYNDTVTTSYYVDDAKPAVTSPSASPAQVKAASALYIGAVVTDVSNVTSVVSNSSVNLTKGASSWNATTSAGALGCAANAVCTIGFTATDMAGNVNNSVTTTVTVDDIAPVLTFVYNSTNLISSATTVTLNITVAEINTVASYTANGLAMTSLGSGRYSVTNTGTALGCTSTGSCTVTFNVTDLAGNSGTTTTSLNIDNDKPVVSGASVTNATTAKNTTVVNIQVTVSDSPAGIHTVLVNSNPMYLLSGTTYHANRTGQQLGCGPDGTCTLTFVVNDTLNNVNNTVTTTYTIDSTAPTNTSAFSASATDTSATVSATFGEAVECTVIYGTNDSVLGSTATSSAFATTGSVSISGLSASTTYYYNVTSCVDEVGNTNTITPNYGTFNFTTTTTPSSGGGGGGGSSGSTAVTVDAGDLTGSETELQLGQGSLLNFKLGSMQHYLKIKSLGGNYADLEVASTPQNFRLYVGYSKYVDIDADGKFDLLVDLLQILGGKAKIQLTSLATNESEIKLLPPGKKTAITPAPGEQTVAEATVPVSEAAPGEQPAAPAQEAAPEVAPVQPAKKMDSNTIIFGVLAAVVVIVLIVMFVRGRKKH